jgi:eukaryotic-like serine/threonine-protein kinase
MGNQDLDELYPRKFGKYHLLGPLAQGGMGALYLAVTGDRGLERLLVIKTILPHLADAEYIARFRDEAKVVIKLSHGNLIPVFDAGQVGGELFLAMDFVEGRDLRAVWNRCAKKQVAFPIDVAVYLVKELCRGLAYAHSFADLDLVHRDVSPPNVLVSYTGEVKLTDFGLASSKLKLEKTAPGIIYGKVAYMSPEQARGERLDGRSDMYAAGIVLWELLTGRQLFPPGKDQPADLVTRAKNPDVMRPSKRAPRVPVELDEICVRALAPERADRYGSCDEMRQALQGWLAQNAPTVDAGRISGFLQDLFSDDIAREREEREGMMNRLRQRALTLPPSHELRQIVERATGLATMDLEPTDVPVRSPGSIGRRATDVGKTSTDRRQNPNRRYSGMEPVASQGSAALARAQALHDHEAEIDLLGTVVDGRYRIDELIGEGGMGKVYLAEHIEIGKRVAVKVLHPSYSRMPELVERFRREARAASKIGHPNIVDVTDSGTTRDGSVYFVMEYLEGVELGSVIERDRAIDVSRALRIATQICRALSAAHSVGVIHRDLKPENVFLITRDNTSDFVKVLDFGIAKTAEAEAAQKQRLTSPGMAMGTPEYMAPEQAAGRPADARCDVYSLSAILYEMLTGEPPYSGDNFMEILTKKATLDPVPPHQLRPELPEPVSRLVLSAMARNPDSRPASMDAFEYELNKCLSGRGAAVAQALGMTDPNLVAMHPALSGRSFDESHMAARPSGPLPVVTPTPSAAEVLHQASRVVELPRPGAPVTQAQWPADSMSARVSEEGRSRARTGVGVFGWVLLALLLAGAGAVGYALVRDPANTIAHVPPTSAAPASKEEVPSGVQSGGEVGKEHVEPIRADRGSSDPKGDGPRAPTGGPAPEDDNGSRPGKRRGGLASDLFDKAESTFAKHDWSQAYKLYSQLEQMGGKAIDPVKLGDVQYKIASALYHRQDYAGAIAKVTEAKSNGYGARVDVLELRADAKFAQGKDLLDARKDYVSAISAIKAPSSGKQQRRLLGKIRDVNAALKRDPDEGVPLGILRKLSK